MSCIVEVRNYLQGLALLLAVLEIEYHGKGISTVSDIRNSCRLSLRIVREIKVHRWTSNLMFDRNPHFRGSTFQALLQKSVRNKLVLCSNSVSENNVFGCRC